ncbi:MAG: DegV family protein [Candidatus Heimdallarchaeota archaeon]|nr:DegV family protein [Candidatus Heimdallarchaeota archaeon]
MTKKFGIMTDSGADFSLDYMKKHDLILIRSRIMIEDTEYIDRDNITREEIIDIMINDKAKTSTSVAPPIDFDQAIRAALEKYEKVLFLGASAKMTATLQNAILTAKRLKTDNFLAVDTETVSWGQSLLIDHAIRRRDQEIPIETVRDEINEMKKNIQLHFMVDTLEYLRRGGRIGAAKSLLGTIMGLKPLLIVKDGEITSSGTVKSYSEGMDKLRVIAEQYSKEFVNYVMVVMYGLDNPEIKAFSEEINKQYKPLHFFYEPIGANIICHAGPYVFGLGILKIPDSAVDAYK